MTENFFKSFAEVEIRDTADGVWAFNTKDNPFLSGVSIIAQPMAGAAGMPTFTVSFTMPYEEGVKYLDSGIFRIGNKVAARIGYVGGLSTPWWWGELNNGGDGVSLTSDGLEGGVTVQCISSRAWGDIPAPDLKGKSGSVLYKMVSSAMGCKLVRSPGAIQVINEKHKPDEDAYPPYPPISWSGAPAAKSAWDWLFFLNATYGLQSTIAFGEDGARNLYVLTKAEAESGVVMDLDGTPSKLVKSRVYRMRGPLIPQEDQYPIFTFGADPSLATWDGMLPPGGSGGVHTTAINVHSGDPVVATAPPGEQESPVNKSVENPSPKNDDWSDDMYALSRQQDEYEMEIFYSTPAPPPPSPKATDDESIKQEAKKVIEQRQAEGNVTQQATIATIGVPDEFPGNLCNVQGCSKRYNGVYKVWTLNHQWAGGIWDMTLTVRREGVGGDGLNQEEMVPLGGTNPEE